VFYWTAQHASKYVARIYYHQQGRGSKLVEFESCKVWEHGTVRHGTVPSADTLFSIGAETQPTRIAHHNKIQEHTFDGSSEPYFFEEFLFPIIGSEALESTNDDESGDKKWTNAHRRRYLPSSAGTIREYRARPRPFIFVAKGGNGGNIFNTL
jgi:hypothetical protein